jgi:hypothetical protein
MTSAFQKLVDDLRDQVLQNVENRKLQQIGRDIVAGGARSRRRGEVLLKSLGEAVVATQASLKEQRIIEKRLHRQRCVNKFEEAKESFAKAIACGEVVGADIAKYEIYLQNVGERISQL